MEIKRPNTPQDGPADGVMGVVECIRTDFLENSLTGRFFLCHLLAFCFFGFSVLICNISPNIKPYWDK